MNKIDAENINGIANQIRSRTVDGLYFKSYGTTICYIPYKGKTQLDTNFWDYSKTTGKYRNIFLGETKKETENKINSGEYILTNLN